MKGDSMKAKSLGLIALGVLSIGILVGFIVGAVTLPQPGKFNLSGMLITWCIFIITSIVMFVFSAILKDQEIQLEKSNKAAIENDPDINDPDISEPGLSNTDSSNTDLTGSGQNTPGLITPEQQPAENEIIGYCDNCGTEIRQGDTMCPECGTPVVVE